MIENCLCGHKILLYLLFQIYMDVVKSDASSPLSAAESVRGSMLFVRDIDETNRMFKVKGVCKCLDGSWPEEPCVLYQMLVRRISERAVLAHCNSDSSGCLLGLQCCECL